MDAPYTSSSYGPADIALVLRELMRNSGYVEWQLAHALDVEIGTVVAWLSGVPAPAYRLTDLSFTLGVSVRQMLERQRYLDHEYERQWRIQQEAKAAAEMLSAAGMVRTTGRTSSVIYYCLSCNRGLGPRGTQWRTRRVLAQSARRCHFCHGSMLAEECLTGGVDRRNHHNEEGIAA